MRNRIRIIMFAMLAVFVLPACHKDDDVVEEVIDKENYFKLEELDFSTTIPHQVNMLFQVTDYDKVGVPDLSIDKFSIYENNQLVGSEASATIAPFGDIPTRIKTVLLLDVSISVQENIDQIKDAAKALVNQKPEYQEFAIYSFSSNPLLIQDFTSDITLLNDAISSITLGTSSTNLYGAIIEGANRMEESSYTVQDILVYNMIVFTDGDDTQASSTLSSALESVNKRDVYMLGLGAEMDQEILKQLGGGVFYSAENITELEQTFLDIQANIEKTANSVYWIYYQTPKRGDNTHSLSLKVKENSNPGADATITNEFNSGIFGDPTGTPPVLPFNPSPADNAVDVQYGVLTWDCSDADGDDLTYDVYFGRTENPSLLVENTQSKTYYLQNLEPNVQYYWKIVVKDTNFNLIEGDVWTFSYIGL